MKCHECNNEMVKSVERYHYKESGLKNVFLGDLPVYRCQCGEEFATIPRVVELNAVIALDLIKKKSFLRGEEIRFLRKNAGLNAKLFAEYLGVDKSTLSRWENNKQDLNKANDRLIRLIYANMKGLAAEEIKRLMDDVIKEIKNYSEDTDINIPVSCLTSNHAECTTC